MIIVQCWKTERILIRAILADSACFLLLHLPWEHWLPINKNFSSETYRVPVRNFNRRRWHRLVTVDHGLRPIWTCKVFYTLFCTFFFALDDLFCFHSQCSFAFSSWLNFRTKSCLVRLREKIKYTLHNNNPDTLRHVGSLDKAALLGLRMCCECDS